MSINIGGGELKELKPRILVLGIGGAGGNAINAMIESGMEGVEFVAINTDAQDLKMSKAHAKIQIGMNLTKGLGAGAKHNIGQAAADESIGEIVNYIQGSNMVFIAAGMGGGTGTGASHVIAKAAKELNILTVGVTTLPFDYEGSKRMRRALEGLEALKKHLDTTIVVPNQNLFKIASEATTFEESFHLSNNVLRHGVQSVTDLMVRPGMINLDFADVETVMSSMGKAMMGTGEAEGENRAMAATEMALNNPLIDEYSLKGAKGLLINITGGKDLTLFEVDQTVQKVRAEVDPEVELIFGAIKDENMEGKMRVSIVATALDGHKTESNTVLNMVSRIHNRNNGYSDSLFSHNAKMENNTLNSIDGSTALKLDDKFEVNEQNEKVEINNFDQGISEQENIDQLGQNAFENIPNGVSIESASYIENKSDGISELTPNIQNTKIKENKHESENTPKLFTEDENLEIENNASNDNETHIEKLFDQENNEEEDFEIPAFLRKQKF
ncbi:MAG: cell division protein FtsZ [Candidatus Pelagibacter sp. TMED273]|nr:MAG: cell division protein FtsZ [Candidatus Pelagibacter sp. TMED273]|tara:strand:+ start:665 stop:2164 length:1500 start_codon:yes stop_codon:yes gene_type:complete